MSSKPSRGSARWVLPAPDGVDTFVFKDTFEEQPLEDEEVAVELYAASLNYRDIVAAKVSFGNIIDILSEHEG